MKLDHQLLSLRNLLYLYSTEARVHSDRWLSSVASDDSTSKLFNLALCFWLHWLIQVVFFHSNYHSFFFFCLNYYSDFYDSLKSLYIHQMIENHLINDWNFLFLICLPVYSYISASVVILIVCIYINLYLFLQSLFMSQRICTHYAHNHLVHEFFNSNSTCVLNLCSFYHVSSAFIFIQLYWLFYKLSLDSKDVLFKS